MRECVALRAQARERLAALEERERTRTGIKQLKVKYASAFGYSIEVGKSNLARIPSDYVRKQTLTNTERFVTPELKELEIAISSAEARQLRLEEALYGNLVESLAARVEAFLATAEAIAELDVYCGLAQVAGERGYTRPEFVAESRLDVADGRHPVMEAIPGLAFVPNDLHAAPGRGPLRPVDRAEHGREVDLPAASGAARDPGADRLVRPRALDVARADRPHLHAHRGRRRPRLGPVDVLRRDVRGVDDPAPLHAAVACC